MNNINNQDPKCVKQGKFYELWSWPKDQTYGVLDNTSEVVIFYSRYKFLSTLYFKWCEFKAEIQFFTFV